MKNTEQLTCSDRFFFFAMVDPRSPSKNYALCTKNKNQIVILCQLSGTAVFFCPRGACPAGPKENTAVPSTRYEGYFFDGALKSPMVGKKRKKTFLPHVGKETIFIFSSPYRGTKQSFQYRCEKTCLTYLRHVQKMGSF